MVILQKQSKISRFILKNNPKNLGSTFLGLLYDLDFRDCIMDLDFLGLFLKGNPHFITEEIRYYDVSFSTLSMGKYCA